MRTYRMSATRWSGFTLLEVLLVIAILGVIAGLVVPQLLGRQQDAMIKATKASISGLEGAMRLYAVDHDGEYPAGTAEQVYPLLLNPQDARGKPLRPYLDGMPKDAWNTPLFYEYPARNKSVMGYKPAIWSAGPNKQNEDGRGDDISNWDNGNG